MYRCPKCKKGMMQEHIENIRWLFYCSQCRIGKIMDGQNKDDAYLTLLELYDEGKIEELTLDEILVREGLIRSKQEIDEMLKDVGDKLIRSILESNKDYVVYYQLLQDSIPEFGNEIEQLNISNTLKEALRDNGINRLFKFQEDAINAIKDGNDVVIVAPTASGKTEAFTIPILEEIKQHMHALFVYPTKALARDQASKISYYANKLGIKVAIFDGDTPTHERDKIIHTKPEIILTNFDTLHYHLIHKTKFSTLLSNIRYLVIDEVHTYTGIFGSHVHYIIKRLARFSRFNIIAASATLPNAKQFCEKLFDRSVMIIEGKGKRGKIHFVMLYPTLRSQRALVLDLLKRLTKEHKTIAFFDSHIATELLAYYGVREGIRIKVHRAGLMPEYRKSVEDKFKKGELMAISATPTLELGIDIGDLDAVISDKIPINRFIQRIGRAARKTQVGYAFLAFGNDPISQYYKNHPDHYLNDLEYAYIDPTNPTVQKYQILAMACDKPLPESYYDDYPKAIEELIDEGLLKHASNKFIPNYKDAIRLLHESNIRGSGKNIDIYINNKKVGERTLPIALDELHDDAVYFLAGKMYKVEKLDLIKYKADLKLLPHDHPYYTRALSEEWPSIEKIYEQRCVYNMQVMHCLLHITKIVTGYSKIEIGSTIAKGTKVMLDKPLEYDFITKGLVFRAPVLDENDPLILTSAYHATEHVIIEGSKMITGGASQDLGGISLGSSGLIFVYDASIGGNGASKVLYDRLEDAIVRGKHILEECKCNNQSGCPRCTYSYRCGNNNEYLHKYAALEVFKMILANVESKVGEVVGDGSLV